MKSIIWAGLGIFLIGGAGLLGIQALFGYLLQHGYIGIAYLYLWRGYNVQRIVNIMEVFNWLFAAMFFVGLITMIFGIGRGVNERLKDAAWRRANGE